MLSPESRADRGPTLTQRLADATGEGFTRLAAMGGAYAFAAVNVLLAYLAGLTLLAIWVTREWNELVALVVVSGVAAVVGAVTVLLVRGYVARREEQQRLQREAERLRAAAADWHRLATAAKVVTQSAAAATASGAGGSLRVMLSRVAMGAAGAFASAAERLADGPDADAEGSGSDRAKGTARPSKAGAGSPVPKTDPAAEGPSTERTRAPNAAPVSASRVGVGAHRSGVQPPPIPNRVDDPARPGVADNGRSGRPAPNWSI